MSRRPKPKQGVLLLIVLSLLVIFMMAGITFVVVAGNYRRGATQVSRLERNGDKPQKVLDRAFLRCPSRHQQPLFIGAIPFAPPR